MKTLNAHIGEVKIAKHGETLKAILGSCVGIGVIWRSKGICGLAHCLLPESPVPTFSIGGRFVNQAIPSLIALMKIKPEDYSEIEVVIAGGGNMTSPDAKDSSILVGANNFRVAEREISKLGLRIVHKECGGEEGRKIFIYATDFTFKVEKIPRLVKAG